MRRLSYGGLHRRGGIGGPKPRVASIPTRDCVDRIEHGDMNDRHRPARPCRAKLLAEYAHLAARHRRMVETACIDRHGIPVSQRSPRRRIVIATLHIARGMRIVAVKRS